MTNIEFFLNVKEHGCFIFNISTSTVVYLIETNEGGLCFVCSVYKWATFCSTLFRSQNNTANLEKTPSRADKTKPEVPHSTHCF